MSDDKKGKTRVDEFFDTIQPNDSEWVKLLLEQLQTRRMECDRAAYRSCTMLIIIWLLSIAVGVGLVEEGTIASFKVAQVKILLVLSPVAIAFFSYTFATTYGRALNLSHVFTRSLKNILPSAYDLGLVSLLSPPTLLGIERSLAKQTESTTLKNINTVWYTIIFLLVVLGSLGALWHVCYLLWQAKVCASLFVVLSSIVGVLIWIRGLLVLVQSYRIGVTLAGTEIER